MSNSSNTDGSLAAVQAVTLSDDSKRNAKTILIRNIVYMFLCIIGLGFFLYVYYNWQKIPYREHYFHAEHLASADSSSRIRAEFTIYDAKILDLDEDFIRSPNYENRGLFKGESLLEVFYAERVLFQSDPKVPSCTPLSLYSLENLRNNILSQQLFSELQDYCSTYNYNIDDYNEVFFFRHLDNETSMEKSGYAPVEIYHKDIYKNYHNIILWERNGFAIADSARESSLGIKTYIEEPIDKNKLEQSTYRNITNAIVLSHHDYYTIQAVHNLKVLLKSKSRKFIETFLKMEDISQAYYSIKMNSNTIPELYLKMEFVGTIECSYTEKRSVKYQINEADTCFKAINVGQSFIELLWKRGQSHVDFDCLIKFNDMENMQSSRLFIIAALITLCITQFIRSLVKIIEASIGLSINGVKSRKRKRLKTLLLIHRKWETKKANDSMKNP